MPATLNDIQAKYGNQVYPLYKDEMHEPYMESDNGIGYKGVVMYDEKEDKIQCSECGNWYKSLQIHLYLKHKTTPTEYKEKNGLFKKVALCSKEMSRKLSEAAQISIKEHNLIPISINKIKSKPRTINSAKKRWNVIQSDNNYGLCDAQIAARLVIVREMAGRKNLNDITTGDIDKYDKKLGQVMDKRYGSRNLAFKALGLNVFNTKKYEDANLISSLRLFVKKKGFIPYVSQLKKYGFKSINTYYNHFGSWRRAKEMAGLDQLLAEVKNEGERN